LSKKLNVALEKPPVRLALTEVPRDMAAIVDNPGRPTDLDDNARLELRNNSLARFGREPFRHEPRALFHDGRDLVAADGAIGMT
jgi:hypothetical protein